MEFDQDNVQISAHMFNFAKDKIIKDGKEIDLRGRVAARAEEMRKDLAEKYDKRHQK